MVLRALTKVWLRFLVQLHDVVRDEWLERVVAIRQVEQGVGHGAEGFGWWVGEDTTGVIREGAISDALMSRDVIGDKVQNGNIPGVSDGCCVFFTFVLDHSFHLYTLTLLVGMKLSYVNGNRS